MVKASEFDGISDSFCGCPPGSPVHDPTVLPLPSHMYPSSDCRLSARADVPGIHTSSGKDVSGSSLSTGAYPQLYEVSGSGPAVVAA